MQEEIRPDDKAIGNPIGWLQEMCMSRRWPPPLYEMENEEGLPHERQFTIACEVFKHRELGTGKSKKLAKRQAALKMWQHLQEVPVEGNGTGTHVLDDDDEVSETPGRNHFSCPARPNLHVEQGISAEEVIFAIFQTD